MKALRVVLLSFVLSIVPLVVAADVPTSGPSALSDVQHTIDDVVKISNELPGKEKLKERRSKLREVINPRFDFIEMAKRCLGANWTQVTEAEQKEFTSVFSELLARTYLSKIETVKPGMVKVDSEKLDFPKSTVKTLVTSKGDVFPIEYKLLNMEGSWRVYDVVIENIGLVANYRNEFSGIIRKETFAGLLKKLHEKNDAAANT